MFTESLRATCTKASFQTLLDCPLSVVPSRCTAGDSVPGLSASEDAARRTGALLLLGMLASAQPQLIAQQLPALVSVGLGPRAASTGNFMLARAACVALQRIKDGEFAGTRDGFGDSWGSSVCFP